MEIINSPPRDIFAVTALLFTENGYHGTSMNDVAIACHIGVERLYDHFENKEALAIAVMTEAQLHFDIAVLSHAYNETIDPKTRLSNMNDATERLFLAESSSYLFLNFVIEKLHLSAPFKAFIEHYFDSWLNAYCKIFSSTSMADEAQSLASDLISNLHGALIMMRVTRSVEPIRRLSARSLRLFDGTVRRQCPWDLPG